MAPKMKGGVMAGGESESIEMAKKINGGIRWHGGGSD